MTEWLLKRYPDAADGQDDFPPPPRVLPGMVYAEKDHVGITPTDSFWPASGIGRVLRVSFKPEDLLN